MEKKLKERDRGERERRIYAYRHTEVKKKEHREGYLTHSVRRQTLVVNEMNN